MCLEVVRNSFITGKITLLNVKFLNSYFGSFDKFVVGAECSYKVLFTPPPLLVDQELVVVVEVEDPGVGRNGE